MKKISLYIYAEKNKSYANNWLDRMVVNPKTNRRVKVKSLSQEDRKKYDPNLKPDVLADWSDADKFNHPSDSEAFSKARKGDTSILENSNLHKTHENEFGHTPLHTMTYLDSYKPLKDSKETFDKVLQHPNVSNAVDHTNTTPLHLLAKKQHMNVLKHKDVAKVKDEHGNTPSWI